MHTSIYDVLDYERPSILKFTFKQQYQLLGFSRGAHPTTLKRTHDGSRQLQVLSLTNSSGLQRQDDLLDFPSRQLQILSLANSSGLQRQDDLLDFLNQAVYDPPDLSRQYANQYQSPPSEQASQHSSTNQNQKESKKHLFQEDHNFYQNLSVYIRKQVNNADPSLQIPYTKTKRELERMLEDPRLRVLIQEISRDYKKFCNYVDSRHCRVTNKDAFKFLFKRWMARLQSRPIRHPILGPPTSQ